MYQRPLYVYFGHHKCASTWITRILESVCAALHRHFAIVHRPEHVDNDFRRFIKEKRVEFLAFTNGDMDYLDQFGEFLAFHVVRDPRDVVVSAYFSHRSTHPVGRWTALPEQRKKLQAVSEAEGLYLTIEFLERENHFERWRTWDFNQANVLELKFEDMIRDPYAAFVSIFAFLGILDTERNSVKRRTARLLRDAVNALHYKSRGLVPFECAHETISRPQLLDVVYAQRFEAQAKGRKAGDEDPNSHFRKGVAGDWRNHFSDEHKVYFKERYNDVLIHLGYETDDTW